MNGRAKIILIIALVSIIVSIASIYFYDRFILKNRPKSLDTPRPSPDEETPSDSQFDDVEENGD